MSCSREQIEAWGYDVDALLAAQTPRAEQPAEKIAIPKDRKKPAPTRGQNKTEAAFARHLDDLRHFGKIHAYWFEPIKILLAPQTTLRLDYIIQRTDMTLAGVDVKGRWGQTIHVEDDAAVKLKVAAGHHKYMDYYIAAWQKRGGWEFRPVDDNGIGRRGVGDQWLMHERHREQV